MREDIKARIDGLIEQAHPREKTKAKKSNKPSTTYAILALVAAFILIFQLLSISAMSAPGTYIQNAPHYKIPDASGLKPADFRFDSDFNFVGCAHFKHQSFKQGAVNNRI